MFDREYHEAIILKVIEEMKKDGIDTYIIITSEGSDSMTRYIPGVKTVGTGAYVFCTTGERYSVSTSIDAQDMIESGLFTESIKYTSFSESIHDLWAKISPKKAMFNFSEDDPFCDGLTNGRFQKFLDAVADLPTFEIVSSEAVMKRVRG